MNDATPSPDLPVIDFEWPKGAPVEELSQKEWLLTNGLGGYASGTLALCNTRRYHGILIASLPGYGRTTMLARISEQLAVDGRIHELNAHQLAAGGWTSPTIPLRRFRLRGLLPEWELAVGEARISRRMVFVHGENTLFLAYQNIGPVPFTLRLRPFPTFRCHDELSETEPSPIEVQLGAEGIEMFTARKAIPLKLRVHSGCPSPFVSLPETSPAFLLEIEKHRGYDHFDRLASPGYFECELAPGEDLTLAMTTDSWDALADLTPERVFRLEAQREQRLLSHAPRSLRTGTLARLALAADQFIIEPTVRPADEAWARATGQNARSVIAGYHWFTDWGRDTMISLEGLTLATHRHAEAAAILRTFEHYVRDGLLPNLFPEGGREGLYHTADATLWFFHAIHRYLEATGDMDLVRDFFPKLETIISKHVEGTRFNIRVDPADGLLNQGQAGVQLTWMDALVDGWVVTPRRGKAVEINALWFNAVSLMAEWARLLGRDGAPYQALADRAFASFNARFWNPAESCLFDVVDGEKGNEPEVRPNQVFAISLQHPVLKRELWAPVLEKVRRELVTPVGLRTLSPSHPQFRPTYDGNLRSRDAAYHQGTVWPWLLGHFVDAWLKVHGDATSARQFLSGLEAQLREACIGQISEIFDASEPHRPRGCIAQAWSVAELLRAWIRTEARPAARMRPEEHRASV